MNQEFVSKPPAEALRAQAADKALRRDREQTDAYHFLVLGDEDGAHAETCVHAEPCSRNYDPVPYPEAVPAEPRLYEGTGIAALYGWPGGEAHAWQLAGWNLRPRSTAGSLR